MTLQDALLEALERPARADAQEAVHTIVINELRRVAPQARIRKTDYFNHSFVPDLVLEWKEDSRESERTVFLRLKVSDAAFGVDLSLLRDQAPLFVGLLDASDGEKPTPTTSPTAAATSTGDALVTNASAISTL